MTSLQQKNPTKSMHGGLPFPPPLNLELLKKDNNQFINMNLPPLKNSTSSANIQCVRHVSKDPMYYKKRGNAKLTGGDTNNFGAIGKSGGFETTRSVTAASPSSTSLLYTISQHGIKAMKTSQKGQE